MNPLLSKCPVCGEPLEVTRLHCNQCDTVIEGHFRSSSNPFASLTPEQVQFVLTFIRCEGRFNRMEDELNLSYPTIRNRLYDVIRALGFEPGKEETAAKPSADDRRKILDDLDQGKITPEQAKRLLQGLTA
ncbi:MAG TPA: DUF2089 domain-containing protein [Anaerolineaceae bacterium]|jgi:hypothetical protein|nr:DUF2089 domain-containing protein [Anaerolineaceae bacterium]